MMSLLTAVPFSCTCMLTYSGLLNVLYCSLKPQIWFGQSIPHKEKKCGVVCMCACACVYVCCCCCVVVHGKHLRSCRDG